jgi:exopolysaccharide biosynthesis polyprenyl glycosylphosphotransferase
MKKSDFIFAVLRLPLDLFSIILGFSLAYLLRARVEIPQETVYMWPFPQYFKFVLIFLPFWAVIFALEGLYNIRRPKNGFGEISSVFLGASAGIMVMVVWIFFSRFLFFSRLIIVYAWLLTFVFVVFGRYLLRLLQKFLHKKKIGLHRVVIIGTGDLAKKLAETIKESPELGFELVKLLDRNSIEKLDKILANHKFEEVILAEPNLLEKEAVKILEFCEDKKLVFKMAPNTFRVRMSNVEVGTLAAHPLIEFKKTPLEGWGKVAKRVVDLIFSFLGLLVLSPLFLLVALCIKLDSKGPIFFKHKRVGNEGKAFYLYKFRSMVENAPKMYKKLAKKQDKHLFFAKIESDPRITRVGRILRATFIDELPQLFNVLKGEMSLVGPRPLTPEEFKRVSSFDKRYSRTSYIKPGMTGLWQVSGRTELSDWQRLYMDIYYVENWSLLSDFLIILKTPLAVLKNKGTY